MNIGAVIRKVRAHKGYNQTQFAEKAGLSSTFLSQIELNRRKPSHDMMESIAKALDLPIYYFYLAGMEDADIAENKKEIYQKIRPALVGLLEGLFID